MMSFGGHTLDMIKRINSNDSLKRRIRKKRPQTFVNSAIDAHQIDNKDVTNEELEAIKDKIRQKAQQNQCKERFLWLIISIGVFLLFWSLYLMIRLN